MTSASERNRCCEIAFYTGIPVSGFKRVRLPIGIDLTDKSQDTPMLDGARPFAKSAKDGAPATWSTRHMEHPPLSITFPHVLVCSAVAQAIRPDHVLV